MTLSTVLDMQPFARRFAGPFALGLLVCASGCVTPAQSYINVRSVFRFGATKAPPEPVVEAPVAPRPPGPGAPLEKALHERGLRFGTDGSVGSVHGYLRNSHRRVKTRDARRGDFVFFDLGQGCGAHGGLVDGVDPSGRITFREWRDGVRLRSYAQPREPRTRRDASGRILNSFLRPKRLDDPAGAKYFAGEMVCAVYRVE